MIKPGAGKRNPFKRSVGSASAANSSSPNPIKHLTDSIVGLPSNDSFGSRASVDNNEKGDADKVATPSGSASTKSPSTRKPFIEWFMERKTELMAEMPEGSNPSELTSFAMKKYKQTTAAATINGTGDGATTTSAKRKLEEKENDGSGIAKLAKFRVET